MCNLISFLLLIVMMFNVVSSVYACEDPPAPLYTPPTFIDLDYRVPEYSDLYVGTMTHFMKVLTQYFPESKVAEEGYLTMEQERKQFIEKATVILQAKKIQPTLLNETLSTNDYINGDYYCISNNNQSSLSFLQGVLADPLIAKENDEKLVKMRLQLFDLCSNSRDKSIPKLTANLKQLQEEAKNGAYPQYLAALFYFYQKEYHSALPLFQELSSSAKSSAWLKETALYMVARTQLIMAQKQWDGVSPPDTAIDKIKLAAAKSSFETYINTYQQGLYTQSAMGLARKIAFLAGDQAHLDLLLKIEMSRLFEFATKNKKDVSLLYARLQEFKHYFKGQINFANDHPLLMAYATIANILGENDVLKPLESRKKDFEPYPGLYDFVRNVILYRNKNFAEIINQKTEKLPIDNLSFISTEVLRAKAYTALGQYKLAIAQWQKINNLVHNNDTAQLYLAANYLKTKDFVGLLKVDSGISNKRILTDSLRFALTEKELETLLSSKVISADNKILVEQELFRRYLLQGQFSAMLKLNSPGIYSPLQSAVKTLNKTPHDPDSLLQIGVFLADHFITPDSAATGQKRAVDPKGLEDLLPYCDFCQQRIDQSKQIDPPYQYFIKAEKEYRKRGVKNDNEAKTLHYLTLCYKGDDLRLRCQWSNQYDNSGENWFNRLHALYPDSEWANKTPYYYEIR